MLHVMDMEYGRGLQFEETWEETGVPCVTVGIVSLHGFTIYRPILEYVYSFLALLYSSLALLHNVSIVACHLCSLSAARGVSIMFSTSIQVQFEPYSQSQH